MKLPCEVLTLATAGSFFGSVGFIVHRCLPVLIANVTIVIFLVVTANLISRSSSCVDANFQSIERLVKLLNFEHIVVPGKGTI